MRASRNRPAEQSEGQLETVDEQVIRQAFQSIMKSIEETKHQVNVQDLEDDYAIAGFRIDELTPQAVRRLHSDIIEKYKVRKLKRNWCENELKLFVWILFHYEAICGRKLPNFKTCDWERVANIFVNKKVDDCKFQWLSLAKVSPPIEDWTEEEDTLLDEIIRYELAHTLRNQVLENKWNDVAKELYKQSEQKYFRRPKQCRERWRNYLDPEISKGEWTQAEDSCLLEYVLEIGKKWSAIAKCIRKRTEHAVKNRFKSLIKKYKKENPKSSRKGKSSDSESEIIKNILKCLEQSEAASEQSAEHQQRPQRKRERPSRLRTSKPMVEEPELKEAPPKPPVREEQPHKLAPMLVTPISMSKDDFNNQQLQWLVPPMTPLTPFSYMDKNKQFGSLIFVTSPRPTISPRFRNVNWPDLEKDHFV